MLFKELTIQNFGIYQGKHVIDLTIEREKPIILLGGLNGGGKTTFLDALQLVLYGKHAQCSNRGYQSYASFLSSTQNRYCNKDALVELSLSFSHKTNTITHDYKIVRNWQVKDNIHTKDTINVSQDDKPDEYLTQNWEEFINEFIPLSLSGLFFFDGEKIENLADPEKSAELVKTGIENLLGVDLINQLHMDLKLIEKKRQLKNIDQSILVKVSEYEKKIEQQNSILLKLKKELAELENTASRTNLEINKARQKVRNSGAHLIEERDNIKYELGAIESKIKNNLSEQVKLASGVGPLGLVSHLIEETKNQINLEMEAKQAQVLSQAINQYESKILNTLTQKQISKTALKQIKATMADLSHIRNKQSNIECYINSNPGIFNGLDERLDSEKKQTEKLAENQIKLTASKELFEKKLETIPDYEMVKYLLKELSKLESNFKTNKQNIVQLQNSLEQAQEKSSILSARYSNLLTQQNKDTFEQKRSIQVIEHINKLKDTLNSFGEKLIAENIENLETLIKDKFLSLGRKKALISHLKISPENFEITLFSENKQSINSNKLSAGERHILAIAILWGLAEASGKKIPTVIDTPLGRLDSLHRTNLIEQYFPKANQQVILLSTDEEISGRYYEKIKPKVNREYHISYNEFNKSSSFEEGYF